MKIITGFGYGGRHPLNVPPMLNTLLCGEEGLLRELEFRAGLVEPTQSYVARIVSYMNALKSADTAARFYHTSFATDPLACAETLLQWRDFSIGHGWNPAPGASSPGRLGDLADVETHAKDLAPCAAERIARLIGAATTIAAVVEEIELHDERALWDTPYQLLFSALKQAGVSITETPRMTAPSAAAHTDLGKLQRQLVGQQSSGSPMTLSGDATLRLYQCAEAHTGADYVSALLTTTPDHLLIANAEHFLLNNALVANGFADPGMGERSYWRVPSQLLSLALQCAWSPPSAESLLQYLTLPAGPHKRLRRRLARRFGDLPGRDTAAWKQAIDDYVAEQIDQDPKIDEGKLRTSIAQWLPVGIAGNAQAMDLGIAIELTDQVKAYWQGRNATDPASTYAKHYLAAFDAADALGEALRTWGYPQINRDGLKRLLDIATGSSSSKHSHIRLVSDLNATESAETARLLPSSPADLVWWGVAIQRQDEFPPFDAAELSAMPDYPDQATLTARRSNALRRAIQPILLAKESATLIAVDESPDLLRLQLEKHLGAACWSSLEQDLIEGRLSEVPATVVLDRPLPTAARWWSLDKAINCPRAIESYSGLSTLALKPHEYCLRYPAQLSQGAAVDLPVDARLKGNLAHRIIESWFTANPWNGTAAPRAQIETWLTAHIDGLIEEFALPMAAPGKRAERIDFQTVLSHAIHRLLEHLANANVASMKIEHKISRPLGGATEIEGAIDLLGQLDDGRWVIIDMKWGSEKRYLAELRNGLHLQLATYAHLAATLTPSQVAEVAYLILISGNLLCTSNAVFPTARVAEPADPSQTTAQVWAAFMKTTDWRCDQLSKGRVEVSYAGALPDADSQPPFDTLPIIDMEEEARKQERNTWGRSFKRVNIWRVLTGQIEE